jgi:hypothetical protein
VSFELLRTAGHNVSWQSVQQRYWKDALGESFDLVVAAELETRL